MFLREVHFYFLAIILVDATASNCPESRKPHPTDCTMFYNCVNLPRGGYVWIPSKCSAGLVFESYLRICVLPGDTWTCNTLSDESTIVKEKHEAPELIQNDYDFNSDPLNLSKVVDSTYSLDSKFNEDNQETTTPYFSDEIPISSLVPENESQDDTKTKIENSIDIKSNTKNYFPRMENKTFLISRVTWLGRIIDNLLIRQSLKILSDKTLLVTNSELKPEIRIEYPKTHLVNSEDALFNHFFTNYIINDILENEGVSSNNKRINTIKDSAKFEILDNKTSKIETHMISNLNESINKTTAEYIIAIKNKFGNKQFFTLEKYQFLKDQLDPNSVDIIHCISGIRLPNNTDCTKYYICEEKTATVMEFFCPPYTGFNEETRICDTQKYSICKQVKNENLESGSDFEEPKAGNMKLMKKSLCETTGKTADPSSSLHYYLCYSNSGKTTDIESVRMTCPNNLIFCAEKKVCSTKLYCMKRNS